MRTQLRRLINDALATLSGADADQFISAASKHQVERPRISTHGDYASNVAMIIAGSTGQKPRVVAELLKHILSSAHIIDAIDIAGPGFLNFTLAPHALADTIQSAVRLGPSYGKSQSGAGKTAGVEFVSANPTGPLHVGHSRGAVLGDCIARVLDANGWHVKREYYYNDGGVQITNLALSVQARAYGIAPGMPGWPASGYCGDYIADVARAYLSKNEFISEGRVVQAAGNPDDLESIRQFSVACLRQEQEEDLKACRVSFDVYFLESELYTNGKVDEVIECLGRQGHTYEQDGALWLRSTTFGDDKDRVMRKSDGSHTYFVPDVAYHLSKWKRGYERAITELGADHHGSLERVKAGLQGLDEGIPLGWPEYVLHQMVTVMRHGEEVKLSKRAGSYMTLRELIDEAGCDAVRWYMVARRPDSQLTFDIDKARSQSLDNPVYYVQLSHARICGLFRQLSERGLPWDPSGSGHLQQEVKSGSGRALALEIARYPDIVVAAGETLEPHLIAGHLFELAQAFQSYYNDHHFLVEDVSTRNTRLAIAAATQTVLLNGLTLLGISAPEEM
ncbi:arginine--tRNA ligase [Stenotrophomonas maltophilia]|uniref:arginine--tRNA ligase n=1 Tax=Stenotrophomonas maltophilia TaxID=40324 RepID=UPI0039C9F72D